MKINVNYSLFIAIAVTILGVSSCTKDKKIVPEEPITPEEPASAVSGVYVLNEGSWADDASLSFFGLTDNTMQNNFFLTANPSMKLGNGGNDMGVYGSKLYVTVTGSNKVEIVDAGSGISLETIVIKEPSYVAFHGKHAFVSSYTNQVFVIDTASMTVVKEIAVGKTPEQMAVSGDKLFVANAGWKDGQNNIEEYDNTVSVIDANTLTKINDIVVEKNVTQIHADNKGFVYVVNSPIFAADWVSIVLPSRLFVIDASTMEIKEKLDFAGQAMAIKDNTAYLISNNYQGTKVQFLELNLSTYAVTVKEDQLNGIQNPYGLAVDPSTGDIWIGDAMGYGDNGKAFRFINNINDPEVYDVGVSPRKFVFKR